MRALLLVAIVACASPQLDPPPIDAEPIITVGHGELIGRGGKRLQPTEATFRATQQAYIARLEPGVEGAAEQRARLRAEASDDILADTHYITWLLERTHDAQHATIRAVNSAIRTARGKDLGEVEVVARTTYNGGQKYIDECAAAGVPIPPPVFSTEWQNLMRFDGDEVISLNRIPELWKWEAAPGAANPGICLALPRYRVVTTPGMPDREVIRLLGVICMGTRPARPPVCFWDNPHPGEWEPGGVPGRPAQRALSEFVSGFDLGIEPQLGVGGVCTDCHAGENPFVVHPEVPAFATVTGKFGSDLYEPIVHPNWPQNRDTTRVLDRTPETSPRTCTTCHNRAGAGRRFPNVSKELPGYCDFVLGGVAFDDWTTAVDEAVNRTMPMTGFGPHTDYREDLDDLKTACGQEPIGGKFGEAGFFTSTSFISRPRLVGPLYACAKRIEVRDLALDANVVVTVKRGAATIGTYMQVARRTADMTFDLTSPLEIGDVVEVDQRIPGGMSFADRITVRDWHDDYATLPAPVIDPTEIYQCSSVIAVRHMVGATLHVQVDEAADRWYLGAGDWSALTPGVAPFAVGNKFRARITMCPGDTPSAWSAERAEARPAPATLSTPRLEPPLPFIGQRLVTVGTLTNGTLNRTSVLATPTGNFMTPISWLPDFNFSLALGRAMNAGESVTVRSELCASTKPVTFTSGTALGCNQLPAPRVERAVAGADHIVMAEWVPGARIIVIAGSTEIGDGSGTIITLSRALVAGETIRVVQRLGENCTSFNAHIITVR
jgi:hypothetical protein